MRALSEELGEALWHGWEYLQRTSLTDYEGGAATALFRLPGSCSWTSGRGRWGHERTTRIYVTSALSDFTAEFDVLPRVESRVAALSRLSAILASKLEGGRLSEPKA